MTGGNDLCVAVMQVDEVGGGDLREGGDRVAAIWLHAFTMGFALLSVAGGFAAIYANKIRKGSPHFTTLHGKLGVGAVAPALSEIRSRPCAVSKAHQS